MFVLPSAALLELCDGFVFDHTNSSFIVSSKANLCHELHSRKRGAEEVIEIQLLHASNIITRNTHIFNSKGEHYHKR